VLPRIIFLYDRQTGVSIEDVKSMVSAVDTENLYNVVVDYYDEKGEWFREYFKEYKFSIGRYTKKTLEE
jgi:phage anti-repressor protein